MAWIDASNGQIYHGDKTPATSDFLAPNTPPPGVTHAVLDESGAFVTWADPVTPPDWAGFRQWRRTHVGYTALVDAHAGAVLSLERDIDRGDLDAAAITWARLTAAGAVSADLNADLYAALIHYNCTELAERLQAQGA